MKDYKIFTDSTADLSQELVDLLDVMVVPTDVTIGGKTYRDFPDERELKKADFYAMMRGGEMPTTAVINPERFIEYFEPVLRDGFDILHLVFSSGLTTTMQNSLIAAEELKEKYPDSDILVVDTRAVSLGKGLLTYYAAGMKKDGKTKEEIADWVLQTRDHVCHWFTVDDLDHLKRGGRISGTSAAIGGVLNIKPIMHVSIEGKLEPTDKVRGRKTALEALLKKIETTAQNIEDQTMFFVHGDCADECDYLVEECKKRFGVKTVYSNWIGPVIGAHAGPGAIALFFIGSKK